MIEERGPRASRYQRKMQVPIDRERGNRRYHRSFEEKLRKYEVRAEAYEFVPALMHSLQRYVTGAQQNETEVDLRLAQALDQIEGGRDLVEAAVERHQALPRDLKARVFSTRYLDLPVEHPIRPVDVYSILQRAQLLQFRNVASIPSLTERVPSLALSPAVAHFLGPETYPDACCCPPHPPKTQPDPIPPPRSRYELAFSKLYCVDESDPEWWPNSDEPYVAFGVITEEMAETGVSAFGTHTPEYEDVDDGDTRPTRGRDENLRLFGFAGPRAIDSAVLITTSCFERDFGNASETTSVIRTALTAVATKAATKGGTAGWIVAAAAVLGIGVTYLIDLLGRDDQISGTQALSLTQVEADARTGAVNPHIFEPLHFDGGDDDGIYDVYLKLTRV